MFVSPFDRKSAKTSTIIIIIIIIIIITIINWERELTESLWEKRHWELKALDANGFKRILAYKSFKRSSINLCESIATLTRRLCTEFVDPLTIEPIVASRLIPLDKGNGEVRPIGVGEVIRRIIGKCVTRVAKQDVINASGAMQVCAGQKSGGEAAINAIGKKFFKYVRVQMALRKKKKIMCCFCDEIYC